MEILAFPSPTGHILCSFFRFLLSLKWGISHTIDRFLLKPPLRFCILPSRGLEVQPVNFQTCNRFIRNYPVRLLSRSDESADWSGPPWGPRPEGPCVYKQSKVFILSRYILFLYVTVPIPSHKCYNLPTSTEPLPNTLYWKGWLYIALFRTRRVSYFQLGFEGRFTPLLEGPWPVI